MKSRGHLNAAYEGAGDLEITAPRLWNPPARAKSPLSAIARPRASAQSRAGCLLVTERLSRRAAQLSASTDPRASFATVIGLLYPPPPVIPGIHPTRRDRTGCQDRRNRPPSGRTR